MHQRIAGTKLKAAFDQHTDAESGFVYMRARYYDPSTGVFTSRDPITALTQTPYSYAQDDPLNLTDPSGLFWGEGVLKKATHFVAQLAGTIRRLRRALRRLPTRGVP